MTCSWPMPMLKEADRGVDMAIKCVICSKRQGGLIAHYPLSKEDPDDRVCLACQNHLKRMLASQDPAAFHREREHFQNLFFQGLTSPKAEKLLNHYFDLARFMEPGMSLEKILEDDKYKAYPGGEVQADDLAAFMATHGHDFEGYRIVTYLGPVQIQRIVSNQISGWYRNVGDPFHYMKDEAIEKMARRLEEEKEKAMEVLYEKAIRLGANALIALTFESQITSQAAAILVSAWGTAVQIEAIDK